MLINPSPELERISRRLAAEKGLDEEARLALVGCYLEFLGRAAASREPAFPSLAVDEIWHRHILHTRSYARDCAAWFGTFIHHQPEPVSAAQAPVPADCSAEQPPEPDTGPGAAMAACNAEPPPPPPDRRLEALMAACNAEPPPPPPDRRLEAFMAACNAEPPPPPEPDRRVAALTADCSAPEPEPPCRGIAARRQ